ncbi:sulfatase [Halorussus lipolyticus]|uniref:sulfatase n=1 Tax=Halorussus lipolyticus TaxID=3034024 RepID=UPI0023E768A3|nr:sulfatase [Halorussus sp. DT80]
MTDQASDGPDDRENVVLVTIDSLRADHCGFFGYEDDTTPTLDELASEGLSFESAFSPGPATPESMPVMFTGDWPVDRRSADGDGGTAEAGSGAEAESALAARRERIKAHMEASESLAERMSELGYRTAAFTPNPFTSRHFGFDSGFDHFEDFMGESRTTGGLYERVFQGFLEGDGASSFARVLLNFWQGEEVFKPWETYYNDAISWAKDAGESDDPYFLWLFLMDAHNPYMAGDDYRSQSRWKSFHANYRFWRESHDTPFDPTVHDRLVTAYDDSIRYADACLARLRRDLDDATLVVTGDHGEAFGEHGTYGHEPYLYGENVHVPLVVAGDEENAETGTVERPVSLSALPDLVTSVATGDDPRGVTENWVVSETEQGGRTAIRGAEWSYLAERGERDRPADAELYVGREDREADAPDLREVAEQLAERRGRHRTERQQVADAAADLASGGDL